jgi:hypothetical protein
MSYLIINNKVAAETNETLKSGEEVRIAWLQSGNSLVNAVYAKVSNAKKWSTEETMYCDLARLHDDSGLYKDFYVLR